MEYVLYVVFRVEWGLFGNFDSIIDLGIEKFRLYYICKGVGIFYYRVGDRNIKYIR